MGVMDVGNDDMEVNNQEGKGTMFEEDMDAKESEEDDQGVGAAKEGSSQSNKNEEPRSNNIMEVGRGLALTMSNSVGLKQVMKAKDGLEWKLLTSPEKLNTGDLELREFPGQGAMVELVCKEMENWSVNINYISHHGV